jgi:hypothetical protein
VAVEAGAMVVLRAGVKEVGGVAVTGGFCGNSFKSGETGAGLAGAGVTSAWRSSSAGVMVAAWAYTESVSASTNAAVAAPRPYEEGMRPIIPRVYSWVPEALGRRGRTKVAGVCGIENTTDVGETD